MSEPFNFSVAGLLPTNTKQKSLDPIGDDVNKITEEFAKLLIAQISNQDPDKPAEMTETITQYSQMLSTLGQIKANNALIQFGTVQVGKDVIGKTISFTTGTSVQDGKQVDNLRTGIVTSVDFSTETPRVYVNGYENAVNVADIRNIYGDNQLTSLQSAAQLVGKDVTYYKMAPNPAFVDADTTPDQQPEIPQTFQGTVAEVNFTTQIPTLKISGETTDIPMTSVVKVMNSAATP
jgi:flagellar hook assembly protein FlgD